MKHPIKHMLIALVTAAVIYSCSPSRGERTGREYMPDMAHSIAYEVQSYAGYRFNTWDSASTFVRKDLSMPRLPVAGTIPRGYAGVFYAGEAGYDATLAMLHGKQSLNAVSVPINAHVPYYYQDTEDERLRATQEIRNNPFPITAKGLATGKELYDINCAICHGEKGDGAGYLVRDPDPAKGDPGGKYPAAPANFLLDTFLISSNGRFYHSIMYGKNVMGGYSDKLNFEERWQVIHYIRSLQAGSKTLKYDETANELNPEFGKPGKPAAPAAQAADVAPVPGAAPQKR